MKSLFFLALLSMSSVALALPLAPVNDLNFKPSQTFKNASTVDYDFEGIVKLSNCSGSLIKFEGQVDSAKGIVMTNGHCIDKRGGFLRPGEVLTNFAVTRSMKLFKTKTQLFPITTAKILYATMTKTDVAFYELTETYEQIFAKTGVQPLTLASSRSTESTDIQIISGYWDRGYACQIDGFVETLKEADWTWSDSLRYTKECDTIGGTSGSPILEKGTKTVIAINNTSNEDGARCTMNNPCEVSTDGEVTVLKGVRYGQQTFWTYSCLTPDFKFDLALAGCELPK
jgi:V8-like Glu-specific endopeptidase